MSSPFVPFFGGAHDFDCSYNRNMGLPLHNDWHLRDWIIALDLSQAELDRRTDWGRRKTSDLMTGAQRYNRDTLNEAASALNIAPFEMLLHPSDAMAMRRMRDSALTIAAESVTDYRAAPEVLKKSAR